MGWPGAHLPGLVAAGDTLDEMMDDLKGAEEVYIASLLLWGHDVPDPRPYDGVGNLRTGIAAR